MATRIQLRRDTLLNWSTVNPILAEGEFGIEQDTNKIKIGDGITNWNSLVYFTTSPVSFTKIITGTAFTYVINFIEHTIVGASSITVYNPSGIEVEVLITNISNDITILSNVDLINHKVIIK
jgi:hypothetical protein